MILLYSEYVPVSCVVFADFKWAGVGRSEGEAGGRRGRRATGAEMVVDGAGGRLEGGGREGSGGSGEAGRSGQRWDGVDGGRGGDWDGGGVRDAAGGREGTTNLGTQAQKRGTKVRVAMYVCVCGTSCESL